MEKYFYIDPSINGTNNLSKMAEAIVEEAKVMYSFCVYSEHDIMAIIDKLKIRSDEISTEHPRWRKPHIYFHHNPMTDGGWITIDGWSFTCRHVKEIHFNE